MNTTTPATITARAAVNQEIRVLATTFDPGSDWANGLIDRGASEGARPFESHHPIGSQARLAFALLMYTGVRRSNVVKLGRQHVRKGRLRFTVTKNQERYRWWSTFRCCPSCRL